MYSLVRGKFPSKQNETIPFVGKNMGGVAFKYGQIWSKQEPLEDRCPQASF